MKPTAAAPLLFVSFNFSLLNSFQIPRPSYRCLGMTRMRCMVRLPTFSNDEFEWLEQPSGVQADDPATTQDSHDYPLERFLVDSQNEKDPDNVINFVVSKEHHGQRIDVAVSAAAPKISRTLAGTLVEGGFVHLKQDDGKLKVLNRKSFKVECGMTLQIEIATEETPSEIIPQNLPLEIVYEDEDMIVLNKAANMVVHPAVGNWDGTVVNALAYYLVHNSSRGIGEFVDEYGRVKANFTAGIDVNDIDGEAVSFRPGIVHRLDKGTSGILVVAKTRASLMALSEAFKSRQVKKTYLAITVGNPGKRVTIDKPIGRHPIHRQRMRVVPDPHKRNSGGFAPKDRLVDGGVSKLTGRRAVSYVDSMAFDGKLSVVQVRIETGRTHQIRVHLQDRNTPIYGDDLYGLNDWNQRLSKVHHITRPMLHAYTIELRHPISGEMMKFQASPPEDMERVFRTIWPQIDNERPDIFANKD